MSTERKKAERLPLIGVIPAYSDDRRIRIAPAYLDALRRSGAIGVTLPYSSDPAVVNEYAKLYDGFLFSGGVDLDPIYYGETKQYDSVEIDEARDRFELLLMEAVADTGKPILGICRGVQLLNVAFGGSLIQHMEGHRQSEKGNLCVQKVRVDRDSRLFSVVRSETIRTNTFHHQAVKTVAPALRAVAWAEDGTVEAIESETHPFLIGVQWHPELFFAEESHARALFSAFVRAAKGAEA